MPEEEELLEEEVGEKIPSFRVEQLPHALDRLIGKGMKFKEIFSLDEGNVNINTGIERINQSINDILSTRIGERGFMRSYGSELYKLLFSPNDAILYDLIRIYTQDALQKWERRIVLNNVDIVSTPENIDNHIVYVEIEYKIRNSNVFGSYVYPFRREPMQIGGAQN